jgi:hypothetical protein
MGWERIVLQKEKEQFMKTKAMGMQHWGIRFKNKTNRNEYYS